MSKEKVIQENAPVAVKAQRNVAARLDKTPELWDFVEDASSCLITKNDILKFAILRLHDKYGNDFDTLRLDIFNRLHAA